MRKLHEWREVIFQELLILGFVSSGVLVATDWFFPETRLRGVGLLVGMVSCTSLVVRMYRKTVVPTWHAGGRAERRRAELEAASEPHTLASVREMMPR